MARVRLTLNIGGINYTISSEEEEEYVKRVAEEVNQNMIRTLNGNEKISATMAATLTALEYCDAAKKASVSSDNLRAQIKNYLDDIAGFRSQIERKDKEVISLRSEVKELRTKLKELRANSPGEAR
ncbi:MAG: cell division protein ZapA [Oscillospiraceae bacterium]|jgi:cell division protein ZapA|nr:cell division protein ZapA [Oscillospiraceae bacterium]